MGFEQARYWLAKSLSRPSSPGGIFSGRRLRTTQRTTQRGAGISVVPADEPVGPSQRRHRGWTRPAPHSTTTQGRAREAFRKTTAAPAACHILIQPWCRGAAECPRRVPAVAGRSGPDLHTAAERAVFRQCPATLRECPAAGRDFGSSVRQRPARVRQRSAHSPRVLHEFHWGNSGCYPAVTLAQTWNRHGNGPPQGACGCRRARTETSALFPSNPLDRDGPRSLIELLWPYQNAWPMLNPTHRMASVSPSAVPTRSVPMEGRGETEGSPLEQRTRLAFLI